MWLQDPVCMVIDCYLNALSFSFLIYKIKHNSSSCLCSEEFILAQREVWALLPAPGDNLSAPLWIYCLIKVSSFPWRGGGGRFLCQGGLTVSFKERALSYWYWLNLKGLETQVSNMGCWSGLCDQAPLKTPDTPA